MKQADQIKEKTNPTTIIPIEKKASASWTISMALEEMRPHRNWSDQTYKSYQKDVEDFEDFSLEEGFEPTLGTIYLHHVDKWIKRSYEKNIAYNTTKRRKAALSAIFKFYQVMGVVKTNPFQAADLPEGQVGYHSRALELSEIVDVYETIQHLKEEEGLDIGVTVGVMFFTGLRAHALSVIKVKDVWLDKELIYYDAGIVNNKHQIQFFPIPPRLLTDIQHHIQYYDLQPDDQLLHGLAGLPLRNKQINRLTNKINQCLGWEGEHHVTPHGYRASIATLLDERGMAIDTIKYLLGHAITKENIQFYLRRDQRKLRALRRELTSIENDIYEELSNRKRERLGPKIEKSMDVKGEEPQHQESRQETLVTMEEWIQVMKSNPLLAQKLMEKNLVAMD